MANCGAVAAILRAIITGLRTLYAALWGPGAKARRRLRRGAKVIADRTIVTVTGTVRPRGELLVAPLSGRACVLYAAHARVRTGATNELNLEEVVDVASQRMIAFELETREGVISVEGDAAELALRPSPPIPRSLTREAAFLASIGRARQLVPSSSFEEVAIEPGARVSVQGMAVIESDASHPSERGYRDSGPTRVRLIAHEAHPLTIGHAR